MKYLPRPGVTKVSLCGMFVLVPSRLAFAHCKSFLPLSLTDCIIWDGIEKDYPLEKVLDFFHVFSKSSDEELIKQIGGFCQTLLEKGFIIPKPEETGSETT